MGCAIYWSFFVHLETKLKSSYAFLRPSVLSMSRFNATALAVDDQDSRIVYSSGWQHASSDSEFDLTKSGTDTAGMTATFEFTGEY